MILMALRHNVPDIQADEYWHDMGAGDGKLPFDVFFDWWTSDVGRAAYSPPTLRDKAPARGSPTRK
jgi:hypothetical protein